MVEHALEDFEDHVRLSRKKPRNHSGRGTPASSRGKQRTGDKTIKGRELKHGPFKTLHRMVAALRQAVLKRDQSFTETLGKLDCIDAVVDALEEWQQAQAPNPEATQGIDE